MRPLASSAPMTRAVACSKGVPRHNLFAARSVVAGDRPATGHDHDTTGVLRSRSGRSRGTVVPRGAPGAPPHRRGRDTMRTVPTTRRRRAASLLGVPVVLALVLGGCAPLSGDGGDP